MGYYSILSVYTFSVVRSPSCAQLGSLIHSKLLGLTHVGDSFYWLWEIILACVLHQPAHSANLYNSFLHFSRFRQKEYCQVKHCRIKTTVSSFPTCGKQPALCKPPVLIVNNVDPERNILRSSHYCRNILKCASLFRC